MSLQEARAREVGDLRGQLEAALLALKHAEAQARVAHKGSSQVGDHAFDRVNFCNMSIVAVCES